MKKMSMLHKAGVVLLILPVLLFGCFLPAGTAKAEIGDGYNLLASEGAEEWPELEFDADRYEAKLILEENLEAAGMKLNAEQRIYDFCGKFDRTRLKEIEEQIAEKENESGISIRIFVAEMRMDYEKYFLEECADRLCDNGYAGEDLAIMLLNLDKYDRGVCIQGYGLCESRINDDRIEYILDDIIEWFSSDDYEYGLQLFVKEAAYYATSSNYSVYYKDNSLKGKLHRMPWLFLVLAPLGVALIGTSMMRNFGGGKMTANGATYIQNGNSGLTAKKDEYMRTSVSKTYSPRSSSSGSSGGRSSGGGGRSSGGRSHSGGSRRF